MVVDTQQLPLNFYRESVHIWKNTNWDANGAGILHTFATQGSANVTENPAVPAGTLNLPGGKTLPVIHKTTYQEGLPEELENQDTSLDIIVSRLLAKNLGGSGLWKGGIYTPDLSPSRKVIDNESKNAGSLYLECFQQSQSPDKSFFVAEKFDIEESDEKADFQPKTPREVPQKQVPLNCTTFPVKVWTQNKDKVVYTFPKSGVLPQLREMKIKPLGVIKIDDERKVRVINKVVHGMPTNLPQDTDRDIIVGMEVAEALASSGHWDGGIFGVDTGPNGSVFRDNKLDGTIRLTMYQAPKIEGNSYFQPIES